MSGGGGSGVVAQAMQGAQQPATSNPYSMQGGTPLGQTPQRTQQPYTFGSEGFNSPRQQYQPQYMSGSSMGGFGGGFNPYAQQGYGNPFGMMGGNPFQGMNPYAPQGGYGSPFGGGFQGGYGSPFGGGFQGGYGSPFGGGYGAPRGFGPGVDNFSPRAQPATMRQGPVPQGGYDSYGNLNMNQNMGGYDATMGSNFMPTDQPQEDFRSRNTGPALGFGQTMRSVGGLQGLAAALRGMPQSGMAQQNLGLYGGPPQTQNLRFGNMDLSGPGAMFNKGGKVDE
jgi:hypothetical protein